MLASQASPLVTVSSTTGVMVAPQLSLKVGAVRLTSLKHCTWRLRAAGVATNGAVVSCTSTLALLVVELLHGSVPVQRRVTVALQARPLVTVSSTTGVMVAPQLSLKVGAVKLTSLKHCTGPLPAAGVTTTGAVVSCTSTLALLVVELLHGSVPVQRRVTVALQAGPLVTVSSTTGVMVAPQLSLKVGAVKLTSLKHCTGPLPAAGVTTTGAVVSCTSTLALLVVELLHGSVPVQRRVTVALQAGPLVTVSSTTGVMVAPQLSLKVGAVKLTSLKHCTGPLPAAGVTTTGAVVSCTSTLALLVVELLHGSVPVQRRVTVALQAGPLVTVSSTTGVMVAPQLSLKVGAVKLTSLKHCTGPLPAAGVTTTGAVVSCTSTLALLVVELLHGSVPVQRRVTVALQAGPLVTVSSTTGVMVAPQLSLKVGAVKLTSLKHCTGPLPAAGVTTTGAVVSCTSTLALLVVELLHGSVPVQRRVTVALQAGPLVTVSSTTGVMVAPQLSLKVGAVKLRSLKHCTGPLPAAGVTTTGAVVSGTSTLALVVVDVSHGLVPVQRRVTVALQAGPLVTVSSTTGVMVAPQLSLKVGAVKLRSLKHCTGPLPAAGVTTTGAVVSCTSTLALLVVELLHGSVPVQRRVTVALQAGPVVTVSSTTGVMVAPQLSLKVGGVKLRSLKHCTGPLPAAGVTTTGAVVSCTSTLALLVVELLHGSVPVQRRVTVALQAGPLVTVSSTTGVMVAPQLSLKVGAVKLTSLKHCTGPLPAAGVTTTGAVVSCTSTLALLVVELSRG